MGFMATAQQTSFKYKKYDWEPAPQYGNYSFNDSTDYVLLLSKHLYNYRALHREFTEEKLVHIRAYINNQAGIEEFNKVYLAETEDTHLAAFKARVITGNKVQEITEKQIQKGIFDETGTEFTYFALEGLEKGSIVEYFYITQQSPHFTGVRLDFQTTVPIQRFELDIYSPYYLEYVAKVYNYEAEFELKENRKENIQSLYLNNIPAFEHEKNAPNVANYGRVIFKIHKNTSNKDKENKELVTYERIARNVNAFLHRELGFGESRAVKSLLEQIKAQADSSATLTQNIDFYLKKNFNLLDNSAGQSNELDDIIENRAYTRFGAISLFNHLLREAQIERELVYTSGRDDIIFDGTFIAGPFLNELLFFVPADGLLYDITDEYAYNGAIDPLYTGTQAVFITELKQKVGYLPIIRVASIGFANALFSTDSTKIKVSLSADLAKNEITVDRSLNGYAARHYQTIPEKINDPEKREEAMNSMVNRLDRDATVKSVEFEHASALHLGKRPLRAKAKLANAKLTQKAGNNHFFNIGKLIGEQSNLYQEDTLRRQAILNSYARLYYFDITIDVPENYQIANPEEANIKQNLIIDNQIVAAFESSLVPVDGSYLLRIREYYTGIGYGAENYADYAKVVNAAADLANTKVLLVKKS